MTRVLIYAFPALIDMLMASSMFVCTVRAAQMGCTPSEVANLVTVWSVAYMLMCQVVGRIVDPRNVSRLLIAACLVLVAASVCFIIFPDVRSMYFLVILTASGAAFFFAPFQVFMKCVGEAGARSIAYSAGVYVFSWSAGFAAGPFIAGYLWKLVGWEACHGLNGLAAIVTAVGIYCLKHHAQAAPASAPASEERPARAGNRVDYARMPDLAWLGWVCGGAGVVTFALFRSIFPSSGETYRLSEPAQGTVFFISSAAQGLVGLLLCRSRYWMYRALPVASFGAFGILGLVLFSRAGGAGSFYCAAACHGVYSGSFFFYITFHSLVHRTKSARYVSMNESVVGGASIIGAFFGGMVADLGGLPASYLAGAGLAAAAVITQGIVHRRHAALVREAPV